MLVGEVVVNPPLTLDVVFPTFITLLSPAWEFILLVSTLLLISESGRETSLSTPFTILAFGVCGISVDVWFCSAVVEQIYETTSLWISSGITVSALDSINSINISSSEVSTK